MKRTVLTGLSKNVWEYLIENKGVMYAVRNITGTTISYDITSTAPDKAELKRKYALTNAPTTVRWAYPLELNNIPGMYVRDHEYEDIPESKSTEKHTWHNILTTTGLVICFCGDFASKCIVYDLMSSNDYTFTNAWYTSNHDVTNFDRLNNPNYRRFVVCLDKDTGKLVGQMDVVFRNVEQKRTYGLWAGLQIDESPDPNDPYVLQGYTFCANTNGYIPRLVLPYKNHLRFSSSVRLNDYGDGTVFDLRKYQENATLTFEFMNEGILEVI